jgi:hypothetical protein
VGKYQLLSLGVKKNEKGEDKKGEMLKKKEERGKKSQKGK